jgi:uncharacterized protein YbaP (TraB family)
MLPVRLMPKLRNFCARLALFCSALLLACGSFAQADGAHCPPQPAEPAPERMQALMREAKDRGFLWKVEKPGRSGYLYGSMHVGKQAWSIPGPMTLAALKASDVIALELDILDPAIQSEMSDPARFGWKHFALPPALQKRVEAVARKVCAPMADLASLHPMIQLITVSLLDARFADLEISYGTEIFLSTFARAAHKPVASLESAGLQMRALLAGDPGEMIDGIDRGIALYESGKARLITRRMTDAWAGGNLDDLQNYHQWCECANTEADRKSLRELNDGRNPGLAAGIDRLLAGGKVVFAAAGALHMTGPSALPGLLRKMGYTVTRVAFEKSSAR